MKPKTSKVATFFAFHVDNSKKTQKEIAEEVGYTSTNIITMFKQGLTKIPIPMAPKLAKALGIDPAHFTRMGIEEYMPDLLPQLETVLPGRLYTPHEEEILQVIRDGTKNRDPKLTTAAERSLMTWAKGLAS
jgi:hypothetical protein